MTDSQSAKANLASADLIHSAETVAAAVARVAAEMNEKLADTNPLVLCVMSGGVPFAGHLMTQLDFPLEFDYLHVTRYGQETSGGSLSWRATPSTSVKDRTVIVVDDILDEGITLAAIVERLKAQGAKACYTAVATDKLNGKKKPIRADFVALTVPDRFVFGFGMDVSGHFRNLPAIYAMKGSDMLAVIGGSGLTQLANLDVSHREVVRTPYGDPSGPVTLGQICGRPVAFLARHGYGHTIPPHEVNYRANLWALWKLGAAGVVSVASVGSIRPDLKPGDVVIPHQIIDYTWGRKSTYHEGPDCKVTHIDFTEPYDDLLRQQLIEAAFTAGISVSDTAVYAATQGPRLETAAEIGRYERDGADVVGMTGMPEASLARELGVPYAAINLVVNYAAGRGDSRHGIKFEAIESVLQESMGHVRLIIEKFVGCGQGGDGC